MNSDKANENLYITWNEEHISELLKYIKICVLDLGLEVS